MQIEQGNNFNNQQPKMPKFNMNWLYAIILCGLVALFISGGGDALGGSAAKQATYTEFKQYVNKGYVLSVVANKTESKLKIYINPKNILIMIGKPTRAILPRLIVRESVCMV